MNIKLPRLSRTIFALAILMIGVACMATTVPASAQQSSSSIAQGFDADASNGEIVAGALVSLKPGSSSSVELATTTNVEHLLGVVDKNPLISISPNSKKVQVVLSGTTTVLVSDINGPIKSGDKITASPIAGLGMVATADNQVAGTAQAAFTGTSTQSVTDKTGKTHTIHVGSIPLQVGIAFYQAPGSNFLPPFIQSIANSVAGRQVSLIRILLCTILLLLVFVSVGILIYTSVRGAMTSIGRNPLAARAIRKGLYQVSIVAVVVVGGAVLASYLILNI